MTSDPLATAGSRGLALFEDRYGPAAHERLIAELGRPCVTFAAIAKQFGVTRERVRQWHLALLPDAPRGHARRRLCVAYHRRRRLLTDALFRTFYRDARSQIGPDRIALIETTDGYRRRAVRIDGRLVALEDWMEGSARAARSVGAPAPSSHHAHVEFVYARLTSHDYLFVPAHRVRTRGALDGELPDDYGPFKNTFAALATVGSVAGRACRERSPRTPRRKADVVGAQVGERH